MDLVLSTAQTIIFMSFGLTEYSFGNIRPVMTPAEAIIHCAKIAGGQVPMARALNVQQPRISKWIHRDGQIPAEFVLTCERLYGVSRHVLRPDIYPVEPPAAPPAWRGVDRGAERVSFNRDVDLQGRAA